MSKLPITEADLHAYVDAQLPDSRRAEVEAFLAAQPEEAERLQAYLAQKEALRQLFDPVLDESLPAKLLDLAEPQAAPVEREKTPIFVTLVSPADCRQFRHCLARRRGGLAGPRPISSQRAHGANDPPAASGRRGTCRL